MSRQSLSHTTYLPLMLNVLQRACLIVGGGAVALRRAKSLLEAGAKVTVVAPRIMSAIQSLSVQTHVRRFTPSDLDGVCLVVAATDDPHVNQQISDLAIPRGILVNRADDPDKGQIMIPAHARKGPITLAVYTGGISASAGAVLRDILCDAIGENWPILLETVEPFRIAIQEKIADKKMRQRLLKKLTCPKAIQTLQRQGPEGLRLFCTHMIDKAITRLNTISEKESKP